MATELNECEFCDEGVDSEICIKLGKGLVSFGIDFEGYETPMFCMALVIPSAPTQMQCEYFEAEVCPVCGRRIGGDE